MDSPQTLNEFSYVTNNPVRFVDPSGETALVLSAPLLGALLVLAGATVLLATSAGKKLIDDLIQSGASAQEVVRRLNAGAAKRLRESTCETRSAPEFPIKDPNNEPPKDPKGKILFFIKKVLEAVTSGVGPPPAF